MPYQEDDEVGFAPSNDERHEAALLLLEMPDGGAAFIDALHPGAKKGDWSLVMNHSGRTFVLKDSGPGAIARLVQRYLNFDPIVEEKREKAAFEQSRKREEEQAQAERAAQERRQLFTKSILGGGA